MSEPSVKELYCRYKVPDNIRRHMHSTEKVATYLARKLKRKGEKINLRLVKRAALLHDLFRIVDIRAEGYRKLLQAYPNSKKVWEDIRNKAEGIRHEEFAYLYFKDSEPELAKIIKSHAYGIPPSDKEGNWEEKLVKYADKCVMHDLIVPMKVRLEEGHRRYNHNRKSALDMDNQYKALENEIFRKAGINSLPKHLLSASFKNRARKRAG